MRRVFVGDIHGCLEPLRRLLEKVGFRPGTDVLHPVGDLVNKGPDSEGVLRLCIELGASSVIGNHDLHYLERGAIGDPALAEWLAGQPAVRLLDGVVLVHAGLHPRWDLDALGGLDEERTRYAANVRYCDADGNRPAADWPPPGPPFRPWDDFYGAAFARSRRRAVFGHWARRGLDVRKHAIALDTGCVYGKELTAWIAEEDRIVQVPARP